MTLSDVCLSRTSGLSREQRGLGRLKLAQPTSHVTRTPLSRSKGQRSRSPCCFTHHGVNPSGSCNGERGNVLSVGNYCYVAVCSAAIGALAPTEGPEERGGGISWRPSAYSLLPLRSMLTIAAYFDGRTLPILPTYRQSNGLVSLVHHAKYTIIHTNYCVYTYFDQYQDFPAVPRNTYAK